MYVREPGGSMLSQTIREIIADNPLMPAKAQGHLYTAAMLLTVDLVLKPALEAGKIVIIDRYIPSTYAYQVHVNGMNELLPCVKGLPEPDICFYTYSESGTIMERNVESDMDGVGEAFSKYRDKLKEVYDHMFVHANHKLLPIPTYVTHKLRRLNVDNEFTDNHIKAKELVVEIALRDFGMRINRSING